MQRLDRSVMAAINVMHILPFAGPPTHMSPFELAAGLSDIYRKHLDPCERLCLASAALMSLDRDTAEELAKATLHDLRAARPMRRAQT